MLNLAAKVFMSNTKSSELKPTVHSSFDLDKDLVDLKGKVILVTGGNKGIGFATVRHLLRAKAGKVYMAARDEGAAKEAIKLLHDEGLGKEGTKSEVYWHKLDLSDPAKAKASAEEFIKQEDRLHILINNAGGTGSLEMGQGGVNKQHWVNYLGPYILTKTLLPLLKRTAGEPDHDVRIVNVSSSAHLHVPAGARFRSPEDFNIPYAYRHVWTNFLRYGNAKLAMNLWSRKLQEELLPSPSLPKGITVIALHPGAVDTVSIRLGAFRSLAHFLLIKLFGFIEPDFGSHTTLFAAASEQVRDEWQRYQAGWGAYLTDSPVPGSVEEPSRDARDDKLKEELFETTEKILQSLSL